MKATTLTKLTAHSKDTALAKRTARSKSTTLKTLTKRKIDWMALWVYGFLFSGFVSIVYGVAQIYLK